MWGLLFTPICKLHLRYGIEWRWVVWLFAEVGGRAWHESEVKRGMCDKHGNPLDENGNRYPG